MAQEEDIPVWLGPAYAPHPLDLRVQALTETTGRAATLYERR